LPQVQAGKAARDRTKARKKASNEKLVQKKKGAKTARLARIKVLKDKYVAVTDGQ